MASAKGKTAACKAAEETALGAAEPAGECKGDLRLFDVLPAVGAESVYSAC